MDLSGHKALITGAGQGIGRACAEVFASRGAELVLFDKNTSTLDAVTKKLIETGAGVSAHVLDLTDFDLLRAELEKTGSEGLIDILSLIHI